MIRRRRMVGRLLRVRRAPGLAGLALMALLFRAMLPPGFMVVASEDPRALIAMTMCSGVMSELASEIAPDATSGASTANGQEGPASIESHPCAVSGLAVLALPEISADLGVAFAVETSRERFPDAPAPGRGLAAPPPPATGPPVLI